MKSINAQDIIKFPIVLALLASLLFGMSSFAFGMDNMSSKTNCLFGGHSMSICNMNPLEHIQEWQSMFGVILQQNAATLLLLLLASLVLGFMWKRQSSTVSENPSATSQHINGRECTSVANPFQELFSSGILNPKLF